MWNACAAGEFTRNQYGLVSINATIAETFIEAVDGQDAVRCFEERGDSIDLVLMDVVMPKMGGRDAALVMEKINSEVKIVFTTGYSDDSLHTQFIREGNLPLIPKPYGTDLLRAQIRSVLDGDIGHLESSRIAAS